MTDTPELRKLRAEGERWRTENLALKARIDEAMEISVEMRGQLVAGPELADVERIIAALAGEEQP